MQPATDVQPNLVQHSREIHHATRHLFRAYWIGRHAQINAALCGNAILARLTAESRSEKVQAIQTRSTNQKLPSNTTAAEHAGAHRATKMGFSRSFQMIGSATAATMI
jgi:DNA-binding IclR family transcriptional regulator